MLAVELSAADLSFDFAQTDRAIRPLHGINKGPAVAGGLIDLTEPLRALNPPFARLHDCHWPNPDVVDIHAVFPNFEADPAEASSYDFARTDEYLAATLETGAQIVYRLGESIEHTPTKRFAHPPKDFEKWAAICLGIIRHYNEGWAGGARHNIRYWEIWNEPENRPAMWSGSDDDYFRLYAVTARAIKRAYPDLKVGGPAVGHTGRFANGSWQPSAFVTNFLAYCRREALPLDFFSWHCYTADPVELSARAREMRRLLDEHGFKSAESHLNEWNYLPGGSWDALSRGSSPEARERFYREMAGPAGAAFIAAALIGLQEAPVDVCNLFHGELGGFGLFNEHGVPQKNYRALEAFARLARDSRAAAVRGDQAGRVAALGALRLDGSNAALLVSCFAGPQTPLRVAVTNLPWRGSTTVELRRIDTVENLDKPRRQTHAAGGFALELELEAPAVASIELRPTVPEVQTD